MGAYINEIIDQTFKNGTVSRSAPLFLTEFWTVSRNNKYLELKTRYNPCTNDGRP